MGAENAVRFADLGPGRKLVATSLVASVGLGLYGTGSLLFFTTIVGLSVAQVGAGLSLAGFLALAVSVPVGRLADAVGALRLSIGVAVLQALLLGAAVLVTNLVQYLVLIGALAMVEQGGHVARGALVAEIGVPSHRVAISAYMQTAFNLGITVGILACGIVIALDHPVGYYGLVIGNAFTALVTVAVLATIRTRPRLPTPPMTESRWRPVRDLPYLSVALLCGLISVADVVLNVGLPLWIITYTDVPRAFAAWLIGLNTVLIVLLQVRASRGLTEIAVARRRLRASAVLSASAAALFAWSYGQAWFVGLTIMAIGVVVLTVGELLSFAATAFLRYKLAEEEAQGVYGGVFSLAAGVRSMGGPALVTLLMVTFAGGGWVLLAGLFVVVAAATGPVLDWAERTRPVPAAGTSSS